MYKKTASNSTSILGFFKVLIGLALIATFAIAFNALFASRTPQTAGNSQQPASPSLSSTPTKADNQVDPASGWKVYKNDQYGYTIKYPSTFLFTVWDVSKDPLRMHLVSFVPEKYRDTLQPPEIGLVIYENPKGLPLREWLNQHTGDKSQQTSTTLFEKVVDLKQTIVAGLSSLRFVEESPLWGTRATSVLLPTKESIFELFYTNAYTSEDLAQTFDLMLNSFQLTQ